MAACADTLGTNSLDLDKSLPYHEPFGLRDVGDCEPHRNILELANTAALAADQELYRMRVARLVVTSDERVQSFHAMDQPLSEQKIQRTIHRRWLALAGPVAQPVEQRIGADRLAGLQHQLQHGAADLGQPRTALRTRGFGPDQTFLQIGGCGYHVSLAPRFAVRRSSAGFQVRTVARVIDAIYRAELLMRESLAASPGQCILSRYADVML